VTDDDGRLSAPGELRSAPAGEPDSGAGTATAVLADGRPLAELAAEYGLRPSAAQPSVPSYVRQLWRRRHFIMAFATAQNIAMYTQARLGQLWQILTPLLNVAVYYFVFGILLNARRGVPDYLAFLVVGVFVFNFTQRSFITTSRVILDNIYMIRALQFPRASLPLAYVLIELQQMGVAMGVMVVILLFNGERISWFWLLAIPVLVLQCVFNAGVGLFAARLGAEMNDFSQLLPFLMRTWMYVSGVMFSIQGLGPRIPYAVKLALQYNPGAIFVTLMRYALLSRERAIAPGTKPFNAHLCGLWYTKLPKYIPNQAYCHPLGSTGHLWLAAAGWAVVALLIGFFYFWRAEVKYGRG
jgi:teichoic acid transport system permease protein